MRLDKMLAHCGYGTRKQVKDYIRKGYVLVNGEVIYDDDFKIDEENDEVIIADMEVNYKSKVYYILNKPKDVVSATFDNRYQTVCDLLAGEHHQDIFPVGRLDIDTTGFLLMTNDGMLAHILLSPKNHVDKKYHATFTGSFKDDFYKEFERGVTLDDGYVTLPSKVELINDHEAFITIHEGKYHQVKRMFAAFGMEVVELERITFGPLELPNDLVLGEYRELTEEELNKLLSVC